MSFESGTTQGSEKQLEKSTDRESLEAIDVPLVMPSEAGAVSQSESVQSEQPVMRSSFESTQSTKRSEAVAPVGDLVQTPQDRGRIRALKNISRWEKEEAAVAAQQKTSFFGRIKNWFTRRRTPEDDRSLQERMAEAEAAKLLEAARVKLRRDPATLTKEEIVLFSDEEMTQYAKWKVARRRKEWE